jgi:MauM/NapG family ferredoxin protein
VPIWEWERYYDVNVDEHLFEEYRPFTRSSTRTWRPTTSTCARAACAGRSSSSPTAWRETRFRFSEFDDPYVAKGKSSSSITRSPRTAARRSGSGPYEPPPEVPDAEYPFWLNTGRVLEHWHSGTMTRASPQLQRADAAAYVEMHPEDAARWASHAAIWCASSRGADDRPAGLDRRPRQPPRGQVFVPFFDETLLINEVTLDAYDPFSKQPDYKKCAVPHRPVGHGQLSRLPRGRAAHRRRARPGHEPRTLRQLHPVPRRTVGPRPFVDTGARARARAREPLRRLHRSRRRRTRLARRTAHDPAPHAPARQLRRLPRAQRHPTVPNEPPLADLVLAVPRTLRGAGPGRRSRHTRVPPAAGAHGAMTGNGAGRDAADGKNSGGMSRRDLLRGRFLDAWRGPAADPAREGPTGPITPTTPVRHRRSFPLLRPPGAVEEEAFLAACTRCNACADACPHDAITPASERLRAAAGTPLIDPYRAPCRMCEDLPCAAACEPKVLRFDLPRTIGRARIQGFACLAHTGSFCTVCSEHCPEPGAIVLEQGRPRIEESNCTGCGICQHVCPAPENAVLLMPLETRPAAPQA